MPFGPLFAFTSGFVAPRFRRGNPQVHDFTTIGKVAYFGVTAQISDDYDFIYRSSHLAPRGYRTLCRVHDSVAMLRQRRRNWLNMPISPQGLRRNKIT
jgi:hypothetical protein